jgi:regulator of cell morphogenesis and NO signaling
MSSTDRSVLQLQTLSDIVSADSRTAAIFDRLGLDYCCHGHHTLEDAVAESGLDVAQVAAEVEALGPSGAADPPSADWTNLGALTAHIVEHHHAYVRRTTPVIEAWLDKLVARHGARHPELSEVRQIFQELAAELLAHMMKEENILFPYIDALVAARASGRRLPPSPFGTILNPIRMMEAEHRAAGDQLAELRSLTNGYQAPPQACTTYRVCYEELARFTSDLHRHVHLENNVLFPQAVAVERELL